MPGRAPSGTSGLLRAAERFLAPPFFSPFFRFSLLVLPGVYPLCGISKNSSCLTHRVTTRFPHRGECPPNCGGPKILSAEPALKELSALRVARESCPVCGAENYFLRARGIESFAASRAPEVASKHPGVFARKEKNSARGNKKNHISSGWRPRITRVSRLVEEKALPTHSPFFHHPRNGS